MTNEMVLMICITVIILAFIAAVTFVVSLKVDGTMDGTMDKHIREELMHLQKQHNNLYALYAELKNKLEE